MKLYKVSVLNSNGGINLKQAMEIANAAFKTSEGFYKPSWSEIVLHDRLTETILKGVAQATAPYVIGVELIGELDDKYLGGK